MPKSTQAKKVRAAEEVVRREMKRKRGYTLLKKVREYHKLCHVHCYLLVEDEDEGEILTHKTNPDPDWPRPDSELVSAACLRLHDNGAHC